MENKIRKGQKPVAKRKSRFTFLVNEEEKRIIEGYLRQHRIENRSNWMREQILRTICKSLDEDLPMLFSEHEMRR